MKIEAAAVLHSRLPPLLHEKRSRADSPFAAAAAPARQSKPRRFSIRGCRRSYMKSEAALILHSRLPPLLHDDRSRAGSCRSAGRRECGLAITRPRRRRALQRQIRGCRRSYTKIHAVPPPHSRLPPLLHDNQSRAGSPFAAAAAPARRSKPRRFV